MARVMTIAIALSAVACDNPFSASGPEGLDEARQHWVAKGISSYTLTVSQDCFCVEDARGSFRVVVDGGRVSSVTDPATGAPRSASPFVPLTVEALFDRVQQAIDEGVKELDVRYHPNFGYPLAIEIDLSQQPVDGGLEIHASELSRAPQP